MFVIRSWGALHTGPEADSPTNLYLTVAATGLALATLLAAIGLLIARPSFRGHGLLIVAAAAAAASVLPFLLFKWTSTPDTWPWVYFMREWISLLGFAPRPRAVGIALQVVLAAIAASALVGHSAIVAGAATRR